jgi:fibrillarin-like rRNA methylase
LFDAVEHQLGISGFEVEERIELTGYEDNHVLFAVRKME